MYLYCSRSTNFKGGRGTEGEGGKRAGQVGGVLYGKATGVDCLANTFHLQQRGGASRQKWQQLRKCRVPDEWKVN